MIKTILFDLDGTLLDINVKKFTKKYFCSLSEFAHIHNYQYTKLLKALLSGVRKMVNNDSEKTNETVFWDNFANVYPVNVEEAKNNFINYYQDDFKKLKTAFSRKKYARKLVDELKRKGYKLVLTTNPTFPLIAIENRMSWTKLTKDDFEFITTYENSYHAKPNLDYYRDVLKRVNCKGEECLIIGNDILAFNTTACQ